MPKTKPSTTTTTAATKITKKSKKEDKTTTATTTTATTTPNTTTTPKEVDNVTLSATTPVEDVKPELAEDFTAFMTKMKSVSEMMSQLRNDFKLIEKKATRELKQANKLNARRKSRQSNRSPSGFVKPTDISGELANFLGKEKGVQMARTEVTREINAYIRKHKLQDNENGRKINADAKLSKLLKLKSGEELTYFNLQKFMSPHFAKGGNPPVIA